MQKLIFKYICEDDDGHIFSFIYPIEEIEKSFINIINANFIKKILQRNLYIGINDNTSWEELTEEERDQWTLDGNLPSEWRGKYIYENDIIEINSDKHKYTLYIVERSVTKWLARNLKCSSFCKTKLTDFIYSRVIGNNILDKELMIIKEKG